MMNERKIGSYYQGDLKFLSIFKKGHSSAGRQTLRNASVVEEYES